MTLVHATHDEIERWLLDRRAARLAEQRRLAKVIAMLPALEIVDATLPLLDAAMADHATLAAKLNAAIAPGWEGFPEAMPMLREARAVDPQCPWRSKLFVLASPRTLVGLGGFKGPPVDGVVEIGYAIAPEYQGRGLATEAARGLIAIALSDIRVTAVDASTLGHPNASTRVLQKVGMQRMAERESEHGKIWQWRVLRGT